MSNEARDSSDFRISQLPSIDAGWFESGSRRPIGDILRGAQDLSDEQIDAILARQSEANMRFGEAAVDLKLVEPEDIRWALAQQFNYPFLLEGQMARYPELVCATDPFSAQAEAVRDLRSQLMSSFPSGQRTPIAIVSPDEGDGKSFLAANLAVAFGQLEGRAVLVDAALRSPRQHVNFRLEADTSTSGLGSVLAGQRVQSLIRGVADVGNVWVVPAGSVPPNPLELLQSSAFRPLLQELGKSFDQVVVDTTAASRGADARMVAMACGTAILVARKGRTALEGLHKLHRSLERVNVNIVGVVLNDF